MREAPQRGLSWLICRISFRISLRHCRAPGLPAADLPSPEQAVPASNPPVDIHDLAVMNKTGGFERMFEQSPWTQEEAVRPITVLGRGGADMFESEQASTKSSLAGT
jgi:hypothetical protein